MEEEVQALREKIWDLQAEREALISENEILRRELAALRLSLETIEKLSE